MCAGQVLMPMDLYILHLTTQSITWHIYEKKHRQISHKKGPLMLSVIQYDLSNST